MKVLLIGSGGRESALAWKISQSPMVKELVISPGNAGMESYGRVILPSVPDGVKMSQIQSFLELAKREKVDFTVVGPEQFLAEGIVDLFQANGMLIFGPTKKAALLESSKVFAKELMRKYNIPTADFKVFREKADTDAYLSQSVFPRVIKADGLAAGKGVIIAKNLTEAKSAVSEMLELKRFGDAGRQIVIEEFIRGEEASIFALTDGKTLLTLPSSQDHKTVFDNDEGPNTGGMGAYCPAPIVTDDILRKTEARILVPTIHAMRKAEHPFIGLLYCGLMISHDEPRVVEFNCRFGDPEAQCVLVKLKSDLMELLTATVEGSLDEAGERMDWDPRPSVNVVLASGGYPGDFKKGYEIKGIEEAQTLPDVHVFHAGTSKRGGSFLTNGGRVLNVVALGKDLAQAKSRAYEAVSRISFYNMHFRKDIADKALRSLSGSNS